ncbi:MAG: M67 family metallopeptidase [Anaerolineae bacterium]|nr:M67 family metallopeptidase [Anaerolineae bacterium]
MACTLPQSMYDEIIAHTKEGGPAEICGMIAGKEGKAVKLYRIANAAENPVVTYFMEPHDQLRAFRDMDEHGWELLAIYHSHPSSENYPSQTDVRQAFYPEAYYIIATLYRPSAVPLRAYRIVDNVITEELVIVDLG